SPAAAGSRAARVAITGCRRGRVGVTGSRRRCRPPLPRAAKKLSAIGSSSFTGHIRRLALVMVEAKLTSDFQHFPSPAALAWQLRRPGFDVRLAIFARATALLIAVP